MQLEDPLGDVQTDCGNLHWWTAPSVRCTQRPELGTSMPSGVVHRVRFYLLISAPLPGPVVCRRRRKPGYRHIRLRAERKAGQLLKATPRLHSGMVRAPTLALFRFISSRETAGSAWRYGDEVRVRLRQPGGERAELVGKPGISTIADTKRTNTRLSSKNTLRKWQRTLTT